MYPIIRKRKVEALRPNVAFGSVAVSSPKRLGACFRHRAAARLLPVDAGPVLSDTNEGNTTVDLKIIAFDL